MQQNRICAERGNLENNSHPEFISGSFYIRCGKLVQHDKESF
ncbi:MULTISPECIES: hypothetical protein [unclassified Rickettsia]